MHVRFKLYLWKMFYHVLFRMHFTAPLREPNIWLPSELSSKHTRIPFGNLKDLSIFCICQLLGTLWPKTALYTFEVLVMFFPSGLGRVMMWQSFICQLFENELFKLAKGFGNSCNKHVCIIYGHDLSTLYRLSLGLTAHWKALAQS